MNYENESEPTKVMYLSEPKWREESGVEIPISQVRNSHLQRIERWLRGGGKTLPREGMYAMWYTMISAEMTKRKLAILPDHPASYKRESYNPNVQYATEPGSTSRTSSTIGTQPQGEELKYEYVDDDPATLTYAKMREVMDKLDRKHFYGTTDWRGNGARFGDEPATRIINPST